MLDLGGGTCMLSTAAKILGAGYVCGVDVDGDALEIAQRNVSLSPNAAAREQAMPPRSPPPSLPQPPPLTLQ